MATTCDVIEVYQGIAEEFHRLEVPQKRDRFLLLAADTAYARGDRQEAERLRRLILNRNPNHLLKPYATFEEALRSADIQTYLQQLRLRYPPESAMELWAQLKRTGQTTVAASFPAMPQPSAPLSAFVNGPTDGTRVAGNGPLINVGNIRASEEHAMNDAQPGRPTTNPPSWQTPSPPGQASAGPGIFGLRPEPTPPLRPPTTPSFAPAPPPPAVEEPVAGAWVGGMLCVVAVLAALALLVYVFAAPFVPWW